MSAPVRASGAGSPTLGSHGRTLSAVELFAGAGGAALGLHAAGVGHLACVERDPHAAATLRAAGLPAVESDVLDWLRAGPGLSPDLLWASPPCQPYSAAGKGLGAADPRDGWPLVMLAIEVLRPRWVAIENVARAPARAWAEQLRAAGFPWVAHRILDAADYGVPQHRRRVFLVAGPQPIRWPAATHCDPCNALLISGLLRPWVSCRDALGMSPGGGPSPTVATTDGSGVGGSGGRKRLRRLVGREALSIREGAALQGFPPEHPWQGPGEAIYRQIGNAVPPIMAEVIARAIVEAEL